MVTRRTRTDGWLVRERNTTALVKECWSQLPSRPTPEQLHALCKLCWITKRPDGSAADNTRSVVAPALGILLGIELRARDRAELVGALRLARAPRAVVAATEADVGFVNLYSAFRNTTVGWVRKNRREVLAILRGASQLSSDQAARRLYERIGALPDLPRDRAPMPAHNLLTPVVACLDPRGRAPIINARAVDRVLKELGLASGTLVQQFDGLVGLLNQGGAKDVFDLDTKNRGDVTANMGSSRRGPATTSVPLGEKDDNDVIVLRKAETATQKRLHNTMTTALLKICERHGILPEEGTDQSCRYDVLVPEYAGTERALLIEAKTSDEMPFCRMAVGQLLDYRRSLPNRVAVDLAVMFPTKPRLEARRFLADVGVKVVWLSRGNGRLVGDVRL